MNQEEYTMLMVKSNLKLKSSLCDYSDAYILVKRTITVNNTAPADADANNANKKVTFQNCAPFTNCISEINNRPVDNATDIDLIMPMYNLIEYSYNYLSTSGSSLQYFKDLPALDNNGAIVNFNGANATQSLKFKAKMTGQTGDDGTKEVEITVPLKYLTNFWRTLEMPLINCEITLILTWSANCVIIDVDDQGSTLKVDDTKLYIPVVTLSTQDKVRLLQQLKSGVKRVINWNEYL